MAQVVEDANGDDPLDKTVMLSRQLKLVRGQLDKKSDLCDQLAQELHRIEEQLDAKEVAAREARSLFVASSAELRAAAHASAAERTEHSAEAAALRKRVGSLHGEALAARERRDSTLQRLEDSEAKQNRTEAQSSTWARERAVETARLRRLVGEEEASAKQHADKECRLMEEVRAFREAGKQQAASFERQLQAVRSKTEEDSGVIAASQAAALRRARTEAAEELGLLRSNEEACRTELRECERSRETLETLLASEAASLREHVAAERLCNEELRSSRDANKRLATTEGISKRRNETDANNTARIAQLEARVDELRRSAAAAEGRESAARDRADRLEALLRNERELHEEALGLLHTQHTEGAEQEKELVKEMDHLSSELEQKESDIMTIHFDMVSLKNQLNDQSKELTQSQEALQQERAQIEEKDEMLKLALQKQHELRAQMNDATEKMQAKISQLSKDLDGSRTAYQALQSSTRSIIDGLEADRNALTEQLASVRAEASAEVAALRAELQTREAAAAARRAELEEQLTELQSESERTVRQLQSTVAAQEDALASLRDAVSAEAAKRCALAEKVEDQAELHRRLQGATGECEELTKQLATRAEEANSATVDLAQLRSSLEEASEQSQKLQVEKDALEAKLLEACQAGTQVPSMVEVEELRMLVAERGDECERLKALNEAHKVAVKEVAARLDEEVAQGAAHVAQLEEQLRGEAARGRERQEQLFAAEERTSEVESQLKMLNSALDRSRLLERQALERAQEYRTRLEVLREFGHEAFMQGPSPKADESGALEQHQGKTKGPDQFGGGDGGAAAEANAELDRMMGAAVPDVLLAVELNLGRKVATLSMAPWHTRADFEALVGEFLQEHSVKPVFKAAIVAYLCEMESQVTVYPTTLQADLMELYSQYG